MSFYDLGARRRAVRPSPLFLTVLAVTAIGGVIAWSQDSPPRFFGGSGSRLGDFGVFLLVLGGWIVTVCFHEFAHAYVAYRAGDRSVEMRGYLTLNPFKYTHPVLSILFPLIAIVGGGFALPGGAVYLHPHTFRSKASRSMAAAAGPLVNVAFAVILIAVTRSHFSATGIGTHSRFWSGLAFLAFLQVTSAVLNLLPVPGLDGYGIIEPYLDPETARVGEKIKPWGLLGVIVLIFYVNPLKNAFFDLVDAIYRGVAGNDLGYGLGYQVFRWWVKSPW